jgi:hypothetical protein
MNLDIATFNGGVATTLTVRVNRATFNAISYAVISPYQYSHHKHLNMNILIFYIF